MGKAKRISSGAYAIYCSFTTASTRLATRSTPAQQKDERYCNDQDSVSARETFARENFFHERRQETMDNKHPCVLLFASVLSGGCPASILWRSAAPQAPAVRSNDRASVNRGTSARGRTWSWWQYPSALSVPEAANSVPGGK